MQEKKDLRRRNSTEGRPQRAPSWIPNITDGSTSPTKYDPLSVELGVSSEQWQVSPTNKETKYSTKH